MIQPLWPLFILCKLCSDARIGKLAHHLRTICAGKACCQCTVTEAPRKDRSGKWLYKSALPRCSQTVQTVVVEGNFLETTCTLLPSCILLRRREHVFAIPGSQFPIPRDHSSRTNCGVLLQYTTTLRRMHRARRFLGPSNTIQMFRGRRYVNTAEATVLTLLTMPSRWKARCFDDSLTASWCGFERFQLFPCFVYVSLATHTSSLRQPPTG